MPLARLWVSIIVYNILTFVAFRMLSGGSLAIAAYLLLIIQPGTMLVVLSCTTIIAVIVPMMFFELPQQEFPLITSSPPLRYDPENSLNIVQAGPLPYLQPHFVPARNSQIDEQSLPLLSKRNSSIPV